MTQKQGIDGNCVWSVMDGPIIQSEWDAYVANLRRAVKLGVGYCDTVFNIVGKKSIPNAAQRKQVADLFAEFADVIAMVKGHAVVTDSKLALGVMTALGWVVKKPFKEKVFSDPNQAMDWLESLSTQFQRHELIAALRREGVL